MKPSQYDIARYWIGGKTTVCFELRNLHLFSERFDKNDDSYIRLREGDL